MERWHEYTMLPARALHSNVELARMVRDVDGIVVECGVWRGGAIASIAEVLGPNRSYFLFDSFEGLPPAAEIDGASAAAWQADTTSANYFDNCAAEEQWARDAMARAGVADPTLVRGWFEDTVPQWVAPAPIALLRLDGDWYSSTKVCLDALIPQMAPGGLVLIDDYQAWDGCARAVNEFLGATTLPIRLRESSQGVTWFRIPA